MTKYVKVMFDNKGANYEYKIGEVNVANNWNPSAESGKDFILKANLTRIGFFDDIICLKDK